MGMSLGIQREWEQSERLRLSKLNSLAVLQDHIARIKLYAKTHKHEYKTVIEQPTEEDGVALDGDIISRCICGKIDGRL